MYCIMGRQKNGKSAWIGSDPASGGWHSFADNAWGATIRDTAKTAKAVLSSVSRMGTYYNAQLMDLASFRIHEVALETKPVAPVTDDMREALARNTSLAPTGWRFLVTDASGQRFASPERLWTPSSTVLDEAIRTPYLETAVETLDRMEGDGWRIIIARLAIAPSPVPEAELEARILAEVAAESEQEKDADLSDVDIYRPTF